MRNCVAALGILVLSAVAPFAQPLEPLDADVENIVFGTWVQAAGSMNSALYQDDVDRALPRCAQSMFTVHDERLEALFPDIDLARGDLSVFPFEDGVLIAQAGATTPVPTKLTATQLRTQDSLMLRFATTAFWDGWYRDWVKMTIATPVWGDIVLKETQQPGRNYKILMLMRHNGETGLYVKCEE